MLGVSMQRLCPDQTATEAARKAYVADALYEPAPVKAKVVAEGKPKSKMTAKQQYKTRHQR